MPSRDSEWRVSVNRLHRACDSVPGLFFDCPAIAGPAIVKKLPPGGVARRLGVYSERCGGDARNIEALQYNTGVSGGFRQAGNNAALSREVLSVGTLNRDAVPAHACPALCFFCAW
jgi:hypothetical protein